MKLLLKLAWRNIWRNKRRSLITMASVLFAVFFAILLRSFQSGAYENMVKNMVGSFTGYIQVHELGYNEEKTLEHSMRMPADSIAALESLASVKKVSPRLESFSLVSTGKITKGTLVIGIDPKVELEGLGLMTKMESGTVFKNQLGGGVVLGSELAKYLKASVGETIVFIGQGYHGISANAQYPLVGILKVSNPILSKNLVLMPLAEAQYLYGADQRLTTLIITPENPQDYVTTQKSISNYLPSNYEVQNWEEFMPELKQTIEADSAGGIIMLSILYLIISFGIFGTILMMTAERGKEFGVLVSIGMKRSKLAITSMVEAVLISTLGGIMGALLVLPITTYFHYNPLRLLGQAGDALENYGFEPLLPASLNPSITLTHTFLIIGISILLSLYAAVKVYTMNPIKELRS